MDWRNYIERDPDVMMGKPVLAGTRITVEFILERLGQGATPDELVGNHTGLAPDHIRPVHAYAASLLRLDESADQVMPARTHPAKPRPSVHVVPVEAAVGAIRHAVQEHPKEFESLGKPANIQGVVWFGRLLGWQWPPSYIGVLRKHNGVRFLNTIVHNFSRSFDILLVFREMWFGRHRYWPVADDGCGSYWVLCFDEQSEDGECPVRFMDHENGPETVGRLDALSYTEFIVRQMQRECRNWRCRSLSDIDLPKHPKR